MKSLINIRIKTGIVLFIWIGCFLIPHSMESQILKKLSKAAKEVVKEVETSIVKEVDKEKEQLKNYIRCNLTDEDCIKAAKQEGKEVVLTDSNGEVIKNDDGSPVIYSDGMEVKESSSITDGASDLINYKKYSVEPIDILPIGFTPSNSKLVIGADVWDANENRILNPGWVKYLDNKGKALTIPGPYYQVLNSPKYYFLRYSKEPSMGFILDRHKGNLYESGKQYKYEEKLDRQSKLGAADANSNLIVNKDLRKAVFISDGDIWRADYDWLERRYKNEKQVTKKGVFKGKDILFWFNNDLYIRGNFSQDNPIVRVDLITGELSEIPLNGVFNSTPHTISSSFTNPSGRILCNPGTELLHCYNAEDRKFFQIPIKPEDYASSIIERHPDYQHFIWLTDDVFINIDQSPGMISRVDLKNRSVVNILQMPPGAGGINYKVTPNREFVDIIATKTKPNGRNFNVERFMVNLRNGDITQLNLSPEIVNGEWISDNFYLYGKNDGGLNEVGTWVYSVKSGVSKKIGDIANFRDVLAFPQFNVAYFASSQGVQAIYRVDVSKGTVLKVGDNPSIIYGGAGGYVPYALMEPPLNLGLSGGPVWSNIPNNPENSGTNEPSPDKTKNHSSKEVIENSSSSAAPIKESQISTGVSNNFESGMQRLLDATKDWKQEEKDAAVSAYHSYSRFSHIFDRTCMALEFSKWRKEGKGNFKDLGSLIPEFLSNDENWPRTCLDPENVKTYGRERAEFWLNQSYENISDSEKERVIKCVEENILEVIKENLDHRVAERAHNIVQSLIQRCKQE